MGILIARFFIPLASSRDGIVQGGRSGNTFRPSEVGLHRTLVLIHGVNTTRQITDKKPDGKTDEDSDRNIRVHGDCSLVPPYMMTSALASKTRPERVARTDSPG